jgi:hypothetical protein
VQRLSSFEDKVTPASDIKLSVRVPFAKARTVNVQTADANGTSGKLKFDTKPDGSETVVEFVVPRLDVSAIISLILRRASRRESARVVKEASCHPSHRPLDSPRLRVDNGTPIQHVFLMKGVGYAKLVLCPCGRLDFIRRRCPTTGSIDPSTHTSKDAIGDSFDE